MPVRDSHDKVWMWIVILFGFFVYGLLGSGLVAVFAVAALVVASMVSGNVRPRPDRRPSRRRRP